MEPELTGGTITTIILVPLGLIVCAAAFVLLRRYAAHKDGVSGIFASEDATLARRLSWLAPAAVVATIVLTWWGMYPWKSEYHHWTPVSGVVDTVDSRLVPMGENSMGDKYVVKFQGGDAQYGVLDTRAAGLKPGDKLTITCVRIWQWAGTHGYDCNFVSLERAKSPERT